MMTENEFEKHDESTENLDFFFASIFVGMIRYF